MPNSPSAQEPDAAPFAAGYPVVYMNAEGTIELADGPIYCVCQITYHGAAILLNKFRGISWCAGRFLAAVTEQAP